MTAGAGNRERRATLLLQVALILRITISHTCSTVLPIARNAPIVMCIRWLRIFASAILRDLFDALLVRVVVTVAALDALLE
uniref:Putative secreted protein n=1 Tax=Anopheles triannulatus TaxID=58253 RepID=A0A2M4B403_9DIPT